MTYVERVKDDIARLAQPPDSWNWPIGSCLDS